MTVATATQSEQTTRTARDVMTRDVAVVRADQTLREVAAVLDARHISGAPVVDHDGRLIGVLSENDLLDAARRDAAIPRFAVLGLMPVPDDLFRRAYDDGWKLRAENLMTRKIITAPEDTPLAELAETMVRRRVNRIPIVAENADGSKTLVGIVTREDVLRGLLGLENPNDVPRKGDPPTR
jgi:CBS domain-containing protein